MPFEDGFRLVDDIARVFDPQRWMLIGGLMVHAHALLAGVRNVRSTTDADLVVEIEAGTHYRAAANAISQLGFAPLESIDHRAASYRFTRDTDQIDLMVPDRSAGVRYALRPVLQVPGSASALKRTELFVTPGENRIRIPDLPGALSLKGAAYGIPSVNPVRHLQDAVILFACTSERRVEPPTNSMRANINRLITGLNRPEAWSLADADVSRRAIRGIRLHFRPDWTAPSFVLPHRPPRPPLP